MSKPSAKNNQPAMPVQIKTMFFTEGNPTALLVTTIGRRRNKDSLVFHDAHEALSWCQSNGSNLFYTATNITLS
jgi:hypothetical protein